MRAKKPKLFFVWIWQKPGLRHWWLKNFAFAVIYYVSCLVQEHEMQWNQSRILVANNKFLPHLVPLRTCPLSQTRPTTRTAGGFDGSYSNTTPLMFKDRSVSFRDARMVLDICWVVWFKSTTEVLLGSGTFTANVTVRGTLEACSLSAMSLLRRVPLCSPHSTFTLSIVHSLFPSQPPTVPKYSV